MNELVVMVGLPRSGKSTIVREQYLPNGYAVVEPDAVRMVLLGRPFYRPAEPFVRAIVEVMVDSLLRSGCKVVVDACNITRERRRPWVQRGARFHYVLTGAETCLERAAGMLELTRVIIKMDAMYEPVDIDEGEVIGDGR